MAMLNFPYPILLQTSEDEDNGTDDGEDVDVQDEEEEDVSSPNEESEAPDLLGPASDDEADEWGGIENESLDGEQTVISAPEVTSGRLFEIFSLP